MWRKLFRPAETEGGAEILKKRCGGAKLNSLKTSKLEKSI